MWLEADKKNFEMALSDLSFHGDSILSDATAIVNPAYPFMGLPKDQFKAFVGDVKAAYPDEKLSCTAYDWCFFV